jgi:hypothetical protein
MSWRDWKSKLDGALIPGWREKWHRLWSVRLTLLAGAVDGAALYWIVWQDAIPPAWFFTIGVLLNVAAAVARLVPQRTLE